MRRVLSLLLTLAVVAGLGAGATYAVAYFRPDVLPPWARIAGKQPPPPEPVEAKSPTVLEDAQPDGWCSYRKNTPDCKPSLPTIRLATPETARQIGMETTKATTRTLAPTVTGNAEITFVTHDYAHVTSRVFGRVAEVPADEGDMVKKGQLLVVVDSAEVGSAKAQYLSILPMVDLARKEYTRTASLRASGAASEKEALTAQTTLAKAEAELMNARQKLLNMGLTEDDIRRIAETRDTSNNLKIYAPLSGRLVERHAVAGEAVAPPSGIVTTGQMQSLFDVADTSEMWAFIDIGETDLPKVAIGQDVKFTISGTEQPVFTGKVQLISFAVNAATRTVRVRAGLKNIDERLRDKQYGRATIRVGPERQGVIVPREAVQTDGQVEFVFRPLEGGQRFRTQRVETQPTEKSGEVEVVFGLKPGDEVVTTGSFLLKTELFRENLVGD